MTGRPALHLTPSRGWLNDPLGITHRDGRFHLFFQHVPGGAEWAPACEWGHATSADLVHWTEQPVALVPSEDEVGAWSGCVVPDGSGRLLYTSVRQDAVELGRIREAWPADGGWEEWRPDRVVAEHPSDLEVVSFRDPSVFRDDDGWKMLVGARLAGGTGAALLYASQDLDSWRYVGPLAQRHTSEKDPVWTGSMWECPHLVRTPDGDVLVVSVCSEDGLHDVVAAVGTYDGARFTAESWRRLTAGVPYAATAFTDLEGRPALMTWLRDVADTGSGWAGALSLPLRLDVVDGRARLEVHPAVDALRGPAGGDDTQDTVHDLEWEPGPRSTLEVAGARLTTNGGDLRITAGSRSATLPVGSVVRVLVDGPVLAVTSGGALGALPLPATRRSEPRATAGELRGWTLR